MSTLSHRTRDVILAIGLAQGLLLLWVQVLIRRGALSASSDMVWLVPWYAVALGVPTALQLITTDARDRRPWLFGLGLAVVLALTGAYAGHTIEPSVGTATALLTPYAVTMLIGWYVLLPFVQAAFKTRRLQPEYPDLFEFAWNNIITLLIAEIFTGIFWALLALWAGLFKVIGIRFFADIFYSAYFAYPVTAMVYAFAVYLARNNLSAVITVRRIILAVFKALLPLLAVIILLFLTALPIVGFAPLWATGKATALMLMLQIGLLIFINAVFQDGQGEAPYTNWLRTLVRAAVILLPIYTLMCLYFLYLRIDQHGWSTDRFWAVLLSAVIGLHVFGYATVALRKNKTWMAGMAPANIRIAAVVVALSVIVNSPLLDAKRISAASQVGRLLDGEVTAAAFDYKYLRFDLGRPGNAALARLKELRDHPDAQAIRAAAELALSQTNRYGIQQERFETAEDAAVHFAMFPAGARLDDSFIKYVRERHSPWLLKRCLEPAQRCAVLAIDLNRDNQKEYVVFRVASRWDQSTAVITRVDHEWRLAGTLEADQRKRPESFEELKAHLEKGDYAVADSQWRNLQIGGRTQHFRPQ